MRARLTFFLTVFPISALAAPELGISPGDNFRFGVVRTSARSVTDHPGAEICLVGLPEAARAAAPVKARRAAGDDRSLCAVAFPGQETQPVRRYAEADFQHEFWAALPGMEKLPQQWNLEAAVPGSELLAAYDALKHACEAKGCPQYAMVVWNTFEHGGAVGNLVPFPLTDSRGDFDLGAKFVSGSGADDFLVLNSYRSIERKAAR